MSTEALTAYYAFAGVNTRILIEQFLNDYSHIKCELNGADLINLGVPKGVKVKEILNVLINAKLDGIVKTKDDEAAFVKKYIGGNQ